MLRPRSLPAAAAQGDRLDTLRVLRDRLATEIQDRVRRVTWQHSPSHCAKRS
jgi:hypothetical protein